MNIVEEIEEEDHAGFTTLIIIQQLKISMLLLEHSLSILVKMKIMNMNGELKISYIKNPLVLVGSVLVLKSLSKFE